MANTARLIITGNENEVDLNQVVTAAQIVDPTKQKVDRLATLLVHYKAQEKAFKDATKDMEKEMKALTAELKEYAKEENITKLLGNKADLEFSGRKETEVDPLNLFRYFQQQGNPADFFKFVKVGYTALKDDMGESALKAAGLVVEGFNKWFSLKAVPKV